MRVIINTTPPVLFLPKVEWTWKKKLIRSPGRRKSTACYASAAPGVIYYYPLRRGGEGHQQTDRRRMDVHMPPNIHTVGTDGWMDACMRYVDGCPCAALLLQSPAPATKTSDDHTSQQLIHLVWSVVALHPSLLVRKTGHRIAQVQTRGTSHASQALSITAVRPRRRVTSTPD